MSKYFKYPFADSGDKIAIANDIQPSGVVSYQQGWGYDYQRKLGVDTQAKPVPRQQTNQLNYDITDAIKQYQEHGFYDFITAEMNGGTAFSYSMGAVVRYDMSDAQDGSDVRNFSSKINNNTGNPKDDPDDWSQIDTASLEFATNEETQAGTIDNKIVSPAGLASVTSEVNRRGLIQLATQAEVNSGVNNTKSVTPATFLGAFSNNNLIDNGYQVLPGGLILQWGVFTSSATSTTITLQVPFTTGCFFAGAAANLNDNIGQDVVGSYIGYTATLTQIRFATRSNSGAVSGRYTYFAIGI